MLPGVCGLRGRCRGRVHLKLNNTTHYVHLQFYLCSYLGPHVDVSHISSSQHHLSQVRSGAARDSTRHPDPDGGSDPSPSQLSPLHSRSVEGAVGGGRLRVQHRGWLAARPDIARERRPATPACVSFPLPLVHPCLPRARLGGHVAAAGRLAAAEAAAAAHARGRERRLVPRHPD